MTLITTDTFFNGRVNVSQGKSGYRFSIDAPLLAWHTSPSPGDKILDIGTGCGIVPLIITFRHPETEIFGIELQKELAEIAVQNITDNNMGDRVRIICDDIKNINQDTVSGPCDLIVSNPPYRKTQTGRINPDSQKAVARHEISITMQEVIETGRRLLRTMGKIVTIYPAERLTDVLTQMRAAGIEPKSLRMIHSFEGKEAKLFILESVNRGKPGMTVAPPLVIYKEQDVYSDEVEMMFQP